MKRLLKLLLCAALCLLFVCSCAPKAATTDEMVRVVTINDTDSFTVGELTVACSVSLRLTGGSAETGAGSYTGKLYISYNTALGQFEPPAVLARRFSYQPVGFGLCAPLDAEITDFDDAQYVEFLVTDTGFDTLPSAQLVQPSAESMCLWSDLPFTETSFTIFGGLDLPRAVEFFSQTDGDVNLAEMLGQLMTADESAPLPCSLLLSEDGTATFTIHGASGSETNLSFSGTVEIMEKTSAEAEVFSV